MSRIRILGATGSLGRHVMRQAIGAGHTVSVAVRNPSKLALVLAITLGADVAARSPSLPMLSTLGLTPGEIAAVDAGRPVAKVLEWGGPSEIYVFGAVHIDGTPETYLSAARDVGRLSGARGYLGAGEIRERSSPTDLTGLAFEPDDVQALKSCREAACDVQLPTASIDAFRNGLDFSRPDAAEQANALGRSMVLRMVRSYQQGGDEALGVYRDKQHPARGRPVPDNDGARVGAA